MEASAGLDRKKYCFLFSICLKTFSLLHHEDTNLHLLYLKKIILISHLIRYTLPVLGVHLVICLLPVRILLRLSQSLCLWGRCLTYWVGIWTFVACLSSLSGRYFHPWNCCSLNITFCSLTNFYKHKRWSYGKIPVDWSVILRPVCHQQHVTLLSSPPWCPLWSSTSHFNSI